MLTRHCYDAVYCAHEYTLANAKFAVSVEPSNAKLQERMREVQEKRQRGEPTVPTCIKLEKETNPFLRYSSPEIRQVRVSRCLEALERQRAARA